MYDQPSIALLGPLNVSPLEQQSRNLRSDTQQLLAYLALHPNGATRDELVAVVAERYARSSRLERGRILDEFVAVTVIIASTRCACCAVVAPMRRTDRAVGAASTTRPGARR